MDNKFGPKYHRQRYLDARSKGLCGTCKIREADPGRSSCMECRLLIMKRATLRQKKHYESGKCVYCGKAPYTEGQLSCVECADKKNRHTRHYREDNADKHFRQSKDWRLRRQYNITLADYEEMEKRQDYKCAICRGERPKRGWRVDHIHETGLVRGLLCNKCNVGLGHFKDDPKRIRAAANYLEERMSVIY